MISFRVHRAQQVLPPNGEEIVGGVAEFERMYGVGFCCGDVLIAWR